MILLLEILDTLARLLTFYLINGIWIGCVVACFLFGLLRVLRHGPAKMHHGLVWLAMFVVLVVPLFLSHHEPQSAIQKNKTFPNTLVSFQNYAQKKHAVPDVLGAHQAVGMSADNLEPWPVYFFGVWLAGSLVLLGRLLVGYVRLRVLVHRGHWANADVQTLFQRCKKQWCGRDVRLRFVKNIRGPLAVGIVRPMILVPETFVDDLARDEIEQVLVHELAHIDRQDILGNWLQRWIEALLWINPVVWVLGHRLALAREMACDAWAIRFGQGRASYITCLVHLAELMYQRRSPAVGVGIGGSLKQRIEHLLHKPERVGWFTKRGVWIGAVGVLCVSLLCIQLGALVDVSGRAEAYMRLSKWNKTLAKVLIGNPLPRGIGLSSKVIVVAEEAHWKATQQTIENLLLQPVLTPQPEYVFELIHVLPQEFERYRGYRNLIILGLPNTKLRRIADAVGTEREVVIREDVWASHQVVVAVRASRVEALSVQIAVHGDRIVSAIDKVMDDWLASILYHAGVQETVTQDLAGEFGWQVQVPVAFDVMRDYADQNFVTFAKQLDRRQLWMWVYWEDGVSPDQITPEWCLLKRNWVSARFYGGDQTALDDLKIYQTDFVGKLAVCMEGLWENSEAWQGGPFKNYAVIDADRQRFYMIDMGVYAPNQNKVLHLRQLDALAHTFETPSIYALK